MLLSRTVLSNATVSIRFGMHKIPYRDMTHTQKKRKNSRTSKPSNNCKFPRLKVEQVAHKNDEWFLSAHF